MPTLKIPKTKHTVEIPDTLLKDALKTTKTSIAETIRLGLKILSAQSAYRKLLQFQGKFNLKLNMKELRKDRGF